MSAVDTLRMALYGNPPTADFEPSRAGVLKAFTELYNIAGLANVAYGAIYATRAELVADLDHPEGTFGLVYDDGIYTGVWSKSGASGSGSWSQIYSLEQLQIDIDAALPKAGGVMTGPIVADIPAPARRQSRMLFEETDGGYRAVGWRRDASVVAQGMAARATVGRRASRSMFDVRDALGRAVFRVMRSGLLLSRGLLLLVSDTSKRRASYGLGGMDSRGNRSFWTIDNVGQFSTRLSRRSRAFASDDNAKISVRGSSRVMNLRPGAKFTRALMQDLDGYVYEAVQPRDGYKLNAWLASDFVEPIYTLGQSNNGDGSGSNTNDAARALYASVPYPQHVLALTDKVGTSFVDFFGNTTAEGGQHTMYARLDLSPAIQNPAYGLSPSVLLAQAISGRRRVNGRRLGALPVVASWRGSTPIEDFEPGDVYNLYENLMNAAASVDKVFRRIGMTDIRPKLFVGQGENYSASWDTKFAAVAASYRAGIQAAHGLATLPPLFFSQVNQPSAQPTNGVELDQRTAAVSLYGTGVYCDGPMYHYPLLDQVTNNNIHTTNIGRVMQSEQRALVASLYDAGINFRAVGHSVTFTRTGAACVLKFNNLPGDGQLRIDSDWVPTVANLGIVVARQSDGVALTIAATPVVFGTDEIRFNLTADPATPVRLDYARDTNNQLVTWAGGRGLIYVSSGVTSLNPSLGIPSIIRHYALRMRVVSST